MGFRIMDCLAISTLLFLGNVTASPGGLPNDLVEVKPVIQHSGPQSVVYFVPVSVQQVRQNQFYQRSNNYQGQPQQQYYAPHPQQVTSKPVITPAPVQVTAGYKPAGNTVYRPPATTAYKPTATNGNGHGGSAGYNQQQNTGYQRPATTGYGHQNNAGYAQGGKNVYSPSTNAGFNNHGNKAVAPMTYAPRYQSQKSRRLPLFRANFGFSAGGSGDGFGNSVVRSNGGDYVSSHGKAPPGSRLYFSKQIGTRKTTFEYPPGQVRTEMVHPSRRGYALEFSASGGK